MNIHIALNHANLKACKEAVSNGTIKDTSLSPSDFDNMVEIIGPCLDCLKAKMKAESKRKQSVNEPANRPFQKLHADVMFCHSIHNSKSKSPCIIIYDEFTTFTTALVLKTRQGNDFKDAGTRFNNFLKSKKFLEGNQIATLQTDHEDAFSSFTQQIPGLSLIQSAPNQHCPRAERAIQSIRNKMRSVLVSLPYNLPLHLHTKLLEHTVRMQNFTSNSNTNGKSPNQILFGNSMNISETDLLNLKFGQMGISHIPTDQRNKHQPERGEFGIIVGFEVNNHKNLLIYNPRTRITSIRQKFIPIKNVQELINLLNEDSKDSTFDKENDEILEDYKSFLFKNKKSKNDKTIKEAFDDQKHINKDDPIINSIIKNIKSNKKYSIIDDNDNILPDDIFQSNYISMLEAMSNVISQDNMSINKALKSFTEEEVNNSVLKEIDNIKKYNTWTHVTPEQVYHDQKNENACIIPSLIFLKAKYKNGVFEKLKSRICAGGHKQTEDSFTKMPSGTIDFSTLMIILSMNKLKKSDIYTTDIPSAYLNSDLKELIYMRLTKELSNIFINNDNNLKNYLDENGCLYVKLNKSLYGLKQSGYNWNKKFSDFLIDLGFTQSLGDNCLFYHIDTELLTLLGLHVDDLIISSNNNKLIQIIKEKMSCFGDLNWECKSTNYLGMHLEQLEDHSVNVDLIAMTNKILEKRKINKSSESPSDTQFFIHEEQGDYSHNSTDFKSQLMELMFLARVRIDILKECVFLSTLSNNPGPLAYKKLHKVQSYLFTYPNRYINLGASSMELKAYVDASYALHANGRSHTGYFLTLGDNAGPIAVKSFMQKFTTLSSTEAELLALVDSVKKSIGIIKILNEINSSEQISLNVFQDNKSTIVIAGNGEGISLKSKHFRVRFHFLKELIEDGILIINYLSTEEMLSDFLTKSTTINQFNSQSSKIMNINNNKI